MIDKEELVNIKGGAIAWKYIGIAVGAVISFAIGVIDGYLRPLKCNK